MTTDENPDEVFENEPEAEAEIEENSDEQSNRSFRMMMIGLFAFGGLGVLLIALILIGRQGERATSDAQNQMVQATNTAIAMLAQITPTPLPADTPCRRYCYSAPKIWWIRHWLPGTLRRCLRC
jgi:hypothetical protein